MADSLSYARMVDATPNVANTSDRDVRFPSPAMGQKIFVYSLNAIQQWNGTAWDTVFQGSLGVFNVKDFGAQGDGLTDDTAAIQACIAAAALVFGTVDIPVGTYHFMGLTVPVGVSLRGAGMDIASLVYTPTTGNAITVSGIKHAFEGFSVFPLTTSTGDGITAAGFQFSSMTRVRVRNFVNGLSLTDAIYTGFFNCAFDHNTQDGVNLGLDCNACGFYDCTSTTNGRAGLYCNGSRSLLLSAGSLEGNLVGLDVVADATHPTATTVAQGVYFEGNTTAEIRVRSLDAGVTRPKGTTVRDCYFQPLTLNTVDAIALGYHNGVVIEGNTFDNLAPWAYNHSVVQSFAPTNQAFFKENVDRSTNGVSVVAGAVTQKLPQVFDVKDYGAKGDGTTDDTAAIQAALTACATAGGGTVYAPAGTFRFIGLDVPANVTLKGAGRGVTLFSRYDTSGTSPASLEFGIRLMGSRAGLRDCSARGRYRFDTTPATPTYDSNVCIYGDNVTDCLVENVESYDCHIGFWIGGVIGNAAYSFGGQDRNTFKDCLAYKTYDNGFGIAAKNRTTDVNRYNRVINCRQYSSYFEGGMEIRYNQYTEVTNFSAKDNTNTSSGQGMQFEETDHVIVNGLVVKNCYNGLQAINDSHDCIVTGFEAVGCKYGVLMASCADITVNGFEVRDSGLDGISLVTATVAAGWTRNNERVTLMNGLVDTTGLDASSGIGIEVFGVFATADAAKVTNGLDLKVSNVTVRNTRLSGIDIGAGGRFQLSNVTVQDVAADPQAGIYIRYPTVNGVDVTTAPLQGIADNITFINTASMSRPWYDPNSLVYQGRFRFIGTFAFMPQLRYGGDLNTRYNVRYDTNLAEGLHLYNTTTGFASPRLYLGNLADANGVRLWANAGNFGIATGVTPDGSGGSGTDSLTLTPTQLINTGNLNIGSNARASQITAFLNAAAGQFRTLQYNTAGVIRWALHADNTAEGGANAGSNLSLRAHDDAGTLIDIPLSIARVAGGLATWVRRLVAPRFIGNGTAHVAGDYALSAGWGNTATVSTVAARDSAGRVSITCNGTGILANPTVTLTYKDGTWTVAPVSLPVRADINAPSTATFVPTSDTATTAVWTFLGTPVAGTIYTVSFLTGGK